MCPSYYFGVTKVQEPKLSRKKIRKAGSGVPLTKSLTIPLAHFVEIAAPGNCGDTQRHWVQKGSHKFVSGRSINRKKTG